eukprot:CAMPEP_0170622630 /NCGR_PEP_ID=MMETSP0224-20130122/29237_1 /TAXON_ID=285029 /ORGANISM="Togula jolla, Strain CCCM 725" /LENGTH=210 /DNA_ID=CAMNT_0010948969 /DNA_START=93 /DNA_END=725 /DNA_ORIENTATION=-
MHGNDTVDAMPELVQEWYHAIGTPHGVGNLPWAKECMKRGVDVNVRLDVYGGTALFLAIEQGNWPMMQWLVEEAGADLEILDYGGYNAMDYAAACHYHHPERPPLLPDGSLAPSDIASYLKTRGMRYTWFGAALAEDIDRIWEFLENGQDVDERGGHFNRNAVQEALDNGNIFTARFIMVKGGTVGIMPAQFQFPEESECVALTMGKLAK